MTPDAFSSRRRPALIGERAAVSAAHPLAAAAAQDILRRGGSAADAVIAAHAVIGVLAPEAGGVGGDGFFLVRDPSGSVTAVNAAGRSAAVGVPDIIDDGGASVTVPGLVAGWGELSRRWGKLALGEVLGPAIRLAENGVRPRSQLVQALRSQKSRLQRGGADIWPVMKALDANPQRIVQPALAATLRQIGRQGARWFYDGPLSPAIESIVSLRGGTLTAADLARHASVVAPPITLDWGACRVHLQPPVSQGALLGMVLKALAGIDPSADSLDHVALELTLAAFAFRKDIARGAELMEERLEIDLERASRKRGPRSYLHTAGVAIADDDGTAVSSLLSVFDDFGSAIYVPEGGFVLNNRAFGFTEAPNEPGSNKLPAHTLAPIMIETDAGCLGLATPGADGQVQTLLQVMLGHFRRGLDLPAAIDDLRWRSEDGRLLMERGHRATADLQRRGHEVVVLPAGDIRFGGVVCAGLARGAPFAVSDWRRENWSAVV